MATSPEDVKVFEEIIEKAKEVGAEWTGDVEPILTKPIDEYSGKVYPGFPRKGDVWIRITPGTKKFSRWLKEVNLAHPSGEIRGGIIFPVHGWNDEYDYLLAYARGMAKVFEEAAEVETKVEGRIAL